MMFLRQGFTGRAFAPLKKLLADTARVFTPPFSGLPVILWFYTVVSYIAAPHNPIWLGDLPDPDDYTYLTQTLDWLQGQSWFDNIQHRMSPPEGVAIHYTRLAELPIAGMILFFRAFHYSWQGAAILASYLLPLLYLGLLFAALRWVTARIAGPRWARFSCVIALCAPVLTFKFAPGQVDHHGLEAILTLLATGCVFRLFMQPQRIGWAVAAGLLHALALAIALEVLPWVALTAAVIGLWAVVEGAKASRGALAFGLALFVFSAIFLTFERPQDDLLNPDLLAYSIAYVGLTGGIALALGAAAFFAHIQNIRLRIGFGAVAAAVIGGVYLYQFPDLLAGPYGAMDKKLAQLFFANLEEAVPLVQGYGAWEVLLHIALPVLGFVAACFFWHEAHGEKKWSWLLIASLLGSSLALGLFYQIRVLVYAPAFAPLPLVAFTERSWKKIGATCHGRARFWAEIGLLLLVGPLTTILLPALEDERSFSSGILLFPAQGFDDVCSMKALDNVLNTPHFAARAPLRMINLIDEGPELLFRTPHSVMSAPYHTNVRGNLDAMDFFTAADAGRAHEIARRDGIQLVTMCRALADMYLREKKPLYYLFPDGQTRIRPDTGFAGQLARNEIPDWLQQIPVPGPSNMLLFEVK